MSLEQYSFKYDEFLIAWNSRCFVYISCLVLHICRYRIIERSRRRIRTKRKRETFWPRCLVFPFDISIHVEPARGQSSLEVETSPGAKHHFKLLFIHEQNYRSLDLSVSNNIALGTSCIQKPILSKTLVDKVSSSLEVGFATHEK